uniref:Receptor ligand binding region domain-containing protein n=1 Tax=Gadus morhua TaxID=8049 RepID=A0A8C5AU46_GADMO
MLLLATSLLLLLLGPPGARGGETPRPLQNVTLAIILPQNNTAYPWAWPRIGPAVERAVRAVNADPSLLPHHHLQYFFRGSQNGDGVCSETMAPLMAVDLKMLHDPWAFIGPGCSYTASPVGLFTAHWDVPLVTAGAPAVSFNKSIYHSVTNTGPTHKKLGRFALRVCERFKWLEQVLLLFHDQKVDDRPCYFAMEGIFEELGKANITRVDRVFNEKLLPVNYSDIIPDIQQTGRGESVWVRILTQLSSVSNVLLLCVIL